MSRTERLNPATKVVVKTKPRPACRATASFSHMGGRPTQQDACQIWENTAIGATFVVVCDGVGGSRSGAEASAVVIQTAGQLWKDRGGAFADPKKDLLSLSHVAHNRITDLAVAGEKRAPASTIVALYLTPNEAHWIHAGDSRLYHFRNSQLVVRTRDHSVVQILVDQGEVSEEEMGSHPDQGRLLQSLGTQEYRDPTYGTASIGQTDAFVLCTDGFWERTPWKAMASIFLAEPPHLESALRKVVNRAVQANGPSGDNVTAAIVAPMTPPARSQAGDFLKKLPAYLFVFAVLIVAVGGVGLYKWLYPEPVAPVVDRGSGTKSPTESPNPKTTPPLQGPTPTRADPVLPAKTPSGTPTDPPPKAQATPGTPAAPSSPGKAPDPIALLSRATPEQATAANPFINLFGMKFVPVNVGTRVLFSVWDTRVSDWQAYIDEAGDTKQDGIYGLPEKQAVQVLQKDLSWRNPGFAQTSEDPVVGVSWEDARRFCAWLSNKEGRKYRLPKDAEWSAAVGPQKFPWGDKFPPPPGAGNYGGSGSRSTSPVGTFKANNYGLYDLGGNVQQWCEDEYKPSMNSAKALKAHPFLDQKPSDGTLLRVLRGGSWFYSEETELQSTYHNRGRPTDRRDDVGFRCVLDISNDQTP